MSKVFVLDTHYKPLNPVHPGRARLLLKQGKAAVRATGSFNITTRQATLEGIGDRYCTTFHKSDGYSYGHGVSHPIRPKERRGHSSPG
jgi:hypothetical protein